MFKTKYTKVLDILNSEINIVQYQFNLCSQNNFDYTKDPKIYNELILQNLKLMDKYVNKLEALWDLKRRIQKEIGE